MDDLDFNKNEDNMRLLISKMKRRLSKIEIGGGLDKIKKQHKNT